MREQEKVIQELFDSKEEFRELSRPTAGFITFEEEDAKLLAMKVSNREESLLGTKIRFLEPSEPTDIIWENRHWTRNDIFWRSVKAWIVILILMAGSFMFIWWVSSISSKVAKVFPSTDCDAQKETYGSAFEEFAVHDYDYIYANPNKPSRGVL
jgi:hypothetical protein